MSSDGIEKIDEKILPDLILDYLVFHGYGKTASALTRAKKPTIISSLQTIKLRKDLSDSICAGRILDAIRLLESTFPQFCGLNGTIASETYFRLLCQIFVELIRDKRANEALEFAETRLAPLANLSSSFSAELQRVIVLLAYADPENSTVGNIMAESYRYQLAHQVNSMILGETESKLDMIISQAATVLDLLKMISPEEIPK